MSTVCFKDEEDKSQTHGAEWSVCVSSPGNFSPFEIYYKTDKSSANPWRVFHLQKLAWGDTLFYLLTVKGISWINQRWRQQLQSVMWKIHAKKITVTQQTAIYSCSVELADTTSFVLPGLSYPQPAWKGCFLTVWSPAAERTEEREVTRCELTRAVLWGRWWSCRTLKWSLTENNSLNGTGLGERWAYT